MLPPMPAAWFRALTLEERRRLLPRHLGAGPERAIEPTAFACATQDLWRELPSLAEDQSFDALLRSYGLTPGEFTELLSLAPDELARYLDGTPAWATFALDSLGRGANGAWHVRADTEPVLKLLRPVDALADEGSRRLEAALVELEERHAAPLHDRAHVLDEYRRVVSDDLLEVVIKPLVVEMHIARRSGALRADDPSARFEEFIAQLSEPGAAARFLERYPVILRLAAVRVQQRVAAMLEIIARIASDRMSLAHQFHGGLELGKLTALKLGLGDSHRGGRTVAQLGFESGVRIMYKPRSLRIDMCFQSVLSRVARDLRELPFTFPVLLDRGSYGYMEYVEAGPCASREEVHRFFYRHGVQLAVLYVMGGTDIHQENVLASGEHPVLVDLETLLAPKLAPRSLRPAEALADAALRDSVLGSGLLPYKMKLDPALEPVDISGLGGEREQVAPLRVSTWHAVGTDSMHMKRETAALPRAENLPALGQEQIAPSAFTADIVAGFTRAFCVLRDIQADVQELLRAGAGAHVRVILRPTYEYAFVLGESYHPYHLGDALDRDRVFDHMWAQAWSEPELQRVYSAERRDLWQGDIPLFTARPSSRSLWTSSGEEIPDFFDSTGLECAEQRFESLTEENLDRQVWLIRTSLATSGVSQKALLPSSRASAPVPPSPVAAALEVGDHLARQAFVAGGDAAWIAVSETDPGVLTPTIAGADLYGGVPGIALFLAYLGLVGRRPEYFELARSGLKGVVAGAGQRDGTPASCGAFDGVGGIIYALTHLGALLGDRSLCAIADEYVERAGTLVETTSNMDVVSGAAGCLLALLANYTAQGSGLALRVARRYGDLLVDRTDGRGWMPHDPTSLLAEGFGHGPLGIVYALHRLHAVTMERRYAEVADRALGCLYRSRRDTALALGDALAGPHSWCRGLSGATAALARMSSDSGNGWLSRTVDRLVERMYDAELAVSDCLCHGELGNLDSSLGPKLAASGRRWKGSAMRRARQVLERSAREGWTCGSPVVSPGLMDGLAGVGYQMLRVAAPHRVPSVLYLEPAPRM